MKHIIHVTQFDMKHVHVIITPNLARVTHGNIFSRVAQGLSTHRFFVFLRKTVITVTTHVPHRSHPCMITLIYHFLTAHLLYFFLST